MIIRKHQRFIQLSAVFVFASLMLLNMRTSSQQQSKHHHRQLSTHITNPSLPHFNETMQFDLPQQAVDFCMDQTLPPLDYELLCDPTKPLLNISVFGGYTNQLKMVIVGALYAIQQNRCFFVDGSRSRIKIEAKPDQTLLTRYAEPIGLSTSSPIYQNAISHNNNIELMVWKNIWNNLTLRRVRGRTFSFPQLNLPHIEGHRLKVIALMRLWRLKPAYRDQACKTLQSYHLQGDYISFSVRRGDKHEKEHFEYATPEQYIESAEKIIPKHFQNNTMPKVFVATDDCRAVTEFRQLRPNWTFVSECDKALYSSTDGFSLDNASVWTEQQVDQHFGKFFVELFGMAFAKYWIGIKYSNVSWFILFMRRANMDAIEALSTPGRAQGINFKFWR